MEDKAQTVLDAVFGELSGRGGFDEWFEGCDKGVQSEIKRSLYMAIDKALQS